MSHDSLAMQFRCVRVLDAIATLVLSMVTLYTDVNSNRVF